MRFKFTSYTVIEITVGYRLKPTRNENHRPDNFRILSKITDQHLSDLK